MWTAFWSFFRSSCLPWLQRWKNTGQLVGRITLTVCVPMLLAAGCAASAAKTDVLPTTPGAIATDAWLYEYQGQTVTVPGEWIHLPASEAAELQLWMEQAGGLL